VISRHRSYWDIPLIIVALGWRRRIHFVARRSLLKNPLLRPFVKGYAIIIDRESFKKSDFKQILKAIHNGKIVGIFPEGTTRPSAKVRVGMVHFAQMTGKDILPIKIKPLGPYPPRYPLFPRVEIWIGKAFKIKELENLLSGDEDRKERYAKLSALMMAKVDELGEEKR
jgi:1-acyl-sn-glycerol-3-phosphate acyltransferase